MLEILVRVSPERDLAAHLRITDGMRTVVDDWAVTSADPSAAQRANNPQADPLRPGGHPPFGRYELTAQGPAPTGTQTEYGEALLLFEPVAGQALDAESYGRLGLLAYAGRMAPDTRLRRTQGGLRLPSRAMDLLLECLDDSIPVVLRIEPVQPPPWWAFWRKRLEHPALSARPPQFDAPPLDEATLLAELLRRSKRRARPLAEHEDDWHRRRDTNSDSTSSGDTAGFRGRGGEGGGAGASGGWTDAPAAGRGPGVDAAGRIVTAAGVAGVVAAAALAARDADAAVGREAAGHRDANASGEDDSSAREVAAGSAGAASDAAASDGEGSGWSSASTAY